MKQKMYIHLEILGNIFMYMVRKKFRYRVHNQLSKTNKTSIIWAMNIKGVVQIETCIILFSQRFRLSLSDLFSIKYL